MSLPYLIKYKPKYLKDLYLDSNIINIIKCLINYNSLNILITGNQGCGKTTIINVIINEYYKDIPLDKIKENILFTNSLKEQGLQYYKNEVKTFCQSRCTIPEKNKMVIIDDIDYINDQNQNIFKNSLSKYNSKINFIFTCTNLQKVLDSIISRLLLIKIKLPTQNDLECIINPIIVNENISISDYCKNKIIISCGGSIQILINYIEKISLLDFEVTNELLDTVCTDIADTELENLTKLSVINKNINDSLICVMNIYNKGCSVMDILDSYFNYIKKCKIIDNDTKYNIIKIICKYMTVVNTIHDNEMELCFFINRLCLIDQKNDS